MSEAIIAVPGQDLGNLSTLAPGPGTHIHNGRIYASILGPIDLQSAPKPAGPAKRLTRINTLPRLVVGLRFCHPPLFQPAQAPQTKKL